MPTYKGRRRPRPIGSRPARAVELSSARVAAGLTQRELGALAGTDQSNIAHYETGQFPLTDERMSLFLRIIEEARQ